MFSFMSHVPCHVSEFLLNFHFMFMYVYVCIFGCCPIRLANFYVLCMCGSCVVLSTVHVMSM